MSDIATFSRRAMPGMIRNMFSRQFSTLISGAILLLIALLGLAAPWLAPYSPDLQDLGQRTIPPALFGSGWTTGNWAHPLGTDPLGRDYLSRLLHGTRLSLLIGLGTTAVSAVIGISMGTIAGYFRGKVELVIGFLINVRLSMPIMLIMLSLVGLFGNSTTLIVMVLSCFLWDRFAVVARATSLQMRGREFVLAAKAAGCSDMRILIGEILPNLTRPLLVVATLEVAHAILLESALSFLGLGVKSPAVSWGLMIAEAKDFVLFEPWLINIPGAMVFLLVGAITVFCEGQKTRDGALA